ncbi:MAG: adenylate/guanylate cyclase domain-containing protein [Deltaproteobacteria bacterium]|nr:adenylate/guanylate cyclase domain-containing protein [Deltaproteobacteria bacterium]
MMQNRPGRGVLTGLCAAVLALTVWGAGWLEMWEDKTWDSRVKLFAAPGPATDLIRLILVDQNSLDWAAKENGLTWPWPREMYVAMVGYLKHCGAKALALDVQFYEPSKYGMEDDRALAAALADFGRSAVAVFLGSTTGAHNYWPTYATMPRLELDGLEQWLKEAKFSRGVLPRAAFPVSEVMAGAAALGNVSLAPDEDGIYRRARLFSLFDGRVTPALGLAPYLAAHPKSRGRIEPGRLIINDLVAAIDEQGEVWLNYRGPAGTHQTFSAAAVIQSALRIRDGAKPTIPQTEFKDKYVFIGLSAPGLFDLRSSPTDGVYPGVEIYATMLDNFLAGDFIRRWPGYVTIMLALVLSLGAGVTVACRHTPGQIVGAGVVFGALPIAVGLGSYRFGFWAPLVVLEVAVTLTLALSLLANYALEGRQKRFLKRAFMQYLSPAVVEQLISQPERLELGGERRELSIFFSDLQGFTSISEGLDPRELTTFLNEYLSAMTDIIHEEGGAIDKYEGDAIIAFWNAPLLMSDHPTRAVAAALRCQDKLAEMRPYFKARINKDLFMRVGLNTGLVVVGNMGSRTRFDYTMIGDAVNLAARLEGVNKQFGTYTMISQFTQSRLGPEFGMRELARATVVGRKEPVTIFEPMWLAEYEAKQEILNVFAAGLDKFYAGDFDQALALFGYIAEVDPPAAAYQTKCRTLQEHPPVHWTGVWEMTSK